MLANSGSNEANFRTAAYEAIVAYVSAATNDVIPVIQTTVVTVLQRMEHLLSIHVSQLNVFDMIKLISMSQKNQIVGVDDRNNWNELQGNLCNVVTVSQGSHFISSG